MALIRRFRSPLVALVAIVFSASIAMAAQPDGKGLANASQHAGKTVPVQAAETTTETDETDETTETDESADASDHCNVDLTQDPSVLAGLNHGSVVCTAAQMATPDGYANHGAWVSHWAKMGKGADASAAGKAHKPSN
jgi:hypothetical protein